MRLLFVALLLAASRITAIAGALDDKTPAYYVDRYGPPKSGVIKSTAAFAEPTYGSVEIKGPFSIREFREGDLRVEAIFNHPSLKLAAVRLQLNHPWTEAQIEAALAAYGGDWKPIRLKHTTIRTWAAPDGSRATEILTTIHIQSRAVTEIVEKTLAEFDAKRKAIPKL
jgi:hypothetical protein